MAKQDFASRFRLPTSTPSVAESSNVLHSLEEVLGGENARVRDDAVVTRLRNNYTPGELVAARILKSMGDVEAHKPIIALMMTLDPNICTRLCQAITSNRGNVLPSQITNWPREGSADELKAALMLGKPSGLRPVTQYNMAAVFHTLGAGRSGATLDLQLAGGRATWSYRKGEETDCPKFTYALGDGSAANFIGFDSFMDTLVNDGHQIIKCFSDPYTGFILAYFRCAMTMSYNGSIRKMEFHRHVGSERMLYSLRKTNALLFHPEKGPFAKVLANLLAHYSSLVVESNPVDDMAWLWENRPADTETLASYVDVIKAFRESWDTNFADKIELLEGDFIDALSNLPSGHSHSPGKFSPCGFSQALSQLTEARSYRGSSSDFLNDEAKDVGLRPHGMGDSAVDLEFRYVPVFDELFARGFRKAAIYISGRDFPLVEYYKKKGMEITVYTTERNTPFTVRDFLGESVYLHGDEAVVVDVIPNSINEGGMSTQANEWNSNRVVYARMAECAAKEMVVFARPLVAREAKDVYHFDSVKFAKYFVKWPGVSVQFRPCRAHNGEFVLYLTQGKTSTQLEVLELNPTEKEQVFEALASVIAARVHLANDMRTYAVPCGRWTYVPRSAETEAFWNHIYSIRASPEVRLARREISASSSAASFGEPVSGINIALMPAALQMGLARRKGPVIAAAAPPPAPSAVPPQDEGSTSVDLQLD